MLHRSTNAKRSIILSFYLLSLFVFRSSEQIFQTNCVHRTCWWCNIQTSSSPHHHHHHHPLSWLLTVDSVNTAQNNSFSHSVKDARANVISKYFHIIYDKMNDHIATYHTHLVPCLCVCCQCFFLVIWKLEMILRHRELFICSNGTIESFTKFSLCLFTFNFPENTGLVPRVVLCVFFVIRDTIKFYASYLSTVYGCVGLATWVWGYSGSRVCF